MEYNVEKSIQRQREFCEKKGFPHFAPGNGVCWKCHEQIYQAKERLGWGGKTYTTGIGTKRAGEELVTGCPHCNISYCD